MDKHHCTRPCDTNFISLDNGDHDWGSVDQNGNSHCTMCEEFEVCGGVYLGD